MYDVDRACTVCESVLRSVESSAVRILLQASIAKDSRADCGTTPTAEGTALEYYTRSQDPWPAQNELALLANPPGPPIHVYHRT